MATRIQPNQSEHIKLPNQRKYFVKDFTKVAPTLFFSHAGFMTIILIFLAALLATGCHEEAPAKPAMEWIGISSEGNGFVTVPSGRPFHPWGNNYGNKGGLIEDFWGTDWPTVKTDFQEMKRMGANVVRVHLQFGKFMLAPDKPNPASLDRLQHLLRLAEKNGLYLDLTGLACYRRSDVPAWYDKLSEAERWRAQARFWSAVAATGADSPAVFCYDLINEPVVSTGDHQPDSWYTGELGGLNFLQYLNLDPAGRSLQEIAFQWLGAMQKAIRAQDSRHFITVGLLPFNPGRDILEKFDFVSVHLYPETGKVANALATLRQFTIGKPVVIEETFPLSCSAADLKKFLLDSRPYACGWIGHYNGESIAQLEALEKSGKISLQQSIWLAWERLFVELGPVMKGQ